MSFQWKNHCKETQLLYHVLHWKEECKIRLLGKNKCVVNLNFLVVAWWRGRRACLTDLRSLKEIDFKNGLRYFSESVFIQKGWGGPLVLITLWLAEIDLVNWTKACNLIIFPHSVITDGRLSWNEYYIRLEKLVSYVVYKYFNWQQLFWLL